MHAACRPACPPHHRLARPSSRGGDIDDSDRFGARPDRFLLALHQPVHFGHRPPSGECRPISSLSQHAVPAAVTRAPTSRSGCRSTDTHGPYCRDRLVALVFLPSCGATPGFNSPWPHRGLVRRSRAQRFRILLVERRPSGSSRVRVAEVALCGHIRVPHRFDLVVPSARTR